MMIYQFPERAKPFDPPPLPSDIDEASPERMREHYFALYAENTDLRMKLAESESKRRAAARFAYSAKNRLRVGTRSLTIHS